MTFRDDRTAAQKRTHPVIVLMTDRFLSNWGAAKNGPSYAGWACRSEDVTSVDRWVRGRSDAMRVRRVGSDYYPPNILGHCHIYVVTDSHPALKG